MKLHGWHGVLVLVLFSVSTLAVADDKETGWFDAAELSMVATSGNSDAMTIGFKNELRRVWEKSEYKLVAGGIRSESRPSGGKTGVGALDDFIVVEPEKTTDSERYYIKNSYDREISRAMFWRVGLDGDRNRPSGIEQALVGTFSVGNDWFPDKEGVSFQTTYGVSYTDEEFTSGVSESFAGIRLGYEYDNKLTESTTFESELVLDGSLDESEDYRADFYNAVSVAISKKVALKAGVRLQFRNLPPFEDIEVFAPGGGSLGTAAIEKDDVDTIFATSLVVNF